MEYKKNNDYALSFFYDDDDQPLGFYFRSSQTGDQNSGRGAKYYYVRNAQGDVVQIRNSQNEAVANYCYDAWGKLLSITDANGNKQSLTNDTFSFDNTSIAYINPIRYRGYVYDNETGFYYLNTRYYDPSLRRFINADTTDILNESKDALTDKNLYAYCDNNPVMRSDDGGEFWHLVAGAVAGAIINVVTTVACNVIEGDSITDGLGQAAVTGALNGALTASGVGIVGSIVGGAAIATVDNVISQMRSEDDFSVESMLIDGAVGGICGAISGPGASSLQSGAGGAKQMLNLGVNSVKKTANTWMHQGTKAAAKQFCRSMRYYGKSTIKVTKNLLSKNVRRSIKTGITYSLSKSYAGRRR